METGIRILLLSSLLALAACATTGAPAGEETDAAASLPVDELVRAREAQAQGAPPRVIEPEVERRRIRTARIDAEDIEVGAYFGTLSIEDFGTGAVYGITAAFHVTEDFFLRAEVGRSKAGRTSFEELGGAVQLLTDDERRFTYYNLALGYNFLPGEVFLGRNRAMNSAFYLIGGIGSTEFAGDHRFTVSLGGGYRVLPTDWLAVHVGVQDRLFESDLLGRREVVNNLEAHLGLTVFF